jgi:hypothetical protein
MHNPFARDGHFARAIQISMKGPADGNFICLNREGEVNFGPSFHQQSARAHLHGLDAATFKPASLLD